MANNNNSERSYRNYKQYRQNKYRYEQEQIVFPITVILALAFLIRYWWIAAIIFALLISVCIVARKRIKMKTTQMGYINKNRQRNLGCTEQPGSDYRQKFYQMECLNCGHKYMANGSDIWQRKCPHCQGGKE